MNKQTKIENFKRFVRSHPGLIDHVKSGKQTWKEIFTEWEILGEDDDQWGEYLQRQKPGSSRRKKSKNTKDLTLGQIFNMLKDVDINEVREYVSQFSNTVTGIQEIINHFQSPSKPNHNNQQQRPPNFQNPFFKD